MSFWLACPPKRQKRDSATEAQSKKSQRRWHASFAQRQASQNDTTHRPASPKLTSEVGLGRRIRRSDSDVGFGRRIRTSDSDVGFGRRTRTSDSDADSGVGFGRRIRTSDSDVGFECGLGRRIRMRTRASGSDVGLGRRTRTSDSDSDVGLGRRTRTSDSDVGLGRRLITSPSGRVLLHATGESYSSRCSGQRGRRQRRLGAAPADEPVWDAPESDLPQLSSAPVLNQSSRRSRSVGLKMYAQPPANVPPVGMKPPPC